MFEFIDPDAPPPWPHTYHNTARRPSKHGRWGGREKGVGDVGDLKGGPERREPRPRRAQLAHFETPGGELTSENKCGSR